MAKQKNKPKTNKNIFLDEIPKRDFAVDFREVNFRVLAMLFFGK